MARAGGRQRAATAGASEEESDFFVRALARGLSILALFDIEHPEWSLGDICKNTGISKTSAYRMLRTLEAKEFLLYDSQTERYHLGNAAIPLAYLAISHVGFVRAIRPFLEELAEATGETVELAVASGGGAVVVDQVATTRPFRLNMPTGRVLNNLANSCFRMHAAFMPPAQREKILRMPQVRLTPNTVTDPEEIARRLAEARRTGLAYDLEEQDLGVCAVSAPVFERDGRVAAVVTLVCPAERFGPRERKKKSEVLKRAAARMSEYLGERAVGG
jgi:IclR family acetate operon transcriptional repressor